tara:strand:- start:5978 stop:6586 length:609 start_codon:yes stop_codon:yes gene_type:complete
MSFNFKLYFKYLFNKINFTFINNFTNKSKNINLLLHKDFLYYTSLHLKLASPFYLSQLVDIFAYEINSNTTVPHKQDNSFTQNLSKSQSVVTVYNFHSLQTCDRFYLFILNNFGSKNSTGTVFNSNLFSITELFPAANWLEREVAELHGVVFTGKQDLRNLLLQYGDSTAPFQKSFPTIGVQEMFYDPIKDTLIQNPVTVQL